MTTLPNVKTCSVDGCDKPMLSKGFCNAHYLRHRKGQPLDIPVKSRTYHESCSVPGCDAPHRAKGFCYNHYTRKIRGYDLDKPVRKIAPERGCSVDGCERSHFAKGFCALHWDRNRKNTKLDAPVRRLNRSSRFEDVTWWMNQEGYVVGRWQGRNVLQHRVVWERHHGRALHPFENIHHINGRRDDNRIENLELWTKAQPCGQRPEDLVAWVVENYPDLIQQHMKGKSNDKPAGARRATGSNNNNRRPTSRPDASRRPSSRAVRSR